MATSRSLLCAIALVVVAVATVNAQSASGTGHVGYPLALKTDVSSWFYASYEITSTDLEARAVNSSAVLRAAMDSLGLSNIAVVDFYYAVGANPTTASTKIGRKTATSSSSDVTFYLPVANSTTTSPGAASYVIGGLVQSCTTCLGSYNVKISSQFLIDGVVQPFTAQHDRITLAYDVSARTFASPAARHIVTSGTSTIYVWLYKTIGRGDQDVVLTYTLGTVPLTYADVTLNATLSSWTARRRLVA